VFWVFGRRGVVALLGLTLVSCPYLYRVQEPIEPPESPRPIANINSPYNDYNAAARYQSAREELIFSSDRGGGKRRHYDLWFAKLYFEQDQAYAADGVKPYLPEAMSPNDEFGPVLVSDGAPRIVFASDRAGGHGKLDLWFFPLSKQHEAREFPGVNSADNEAYWTALPGGSEAYFASDRAGGRYDIYRLTPAFGGENPTVERVGELASPADDTAPHLVTLRHRVLPKRRVSLNPGRKDGPASPQLVSATYLLFASNRDGKDFDLYCSRLDGTRWNVPKPLPINTEFDEFRPILLLRGQVIVFSSNRPGGMGGMDLYYARFDNPCRADE
jgi:hypothetical protein